MQTIEKILLIALQRIAGGEDKDSIKIAGDALKERDEVLAANPAMFNCYEIHHVIEWKADGENTICEQVDCLDEPIEVLRGHKEYLKDFWSLYGHMGEGGLMCIGDYNDETTAKIVLTLIGGNEEM